MNSVTVQNGNKEVTLTITGSKEWEGGDKKRVYFDLDQSNRRNVIHKFYEVISGATSDRTVEVGGRTFAYDFGVDCNSGSKRDAAKDAVIALATKITA